MKYVTHDWNWDGGDIAVPFSVPTRRIIRLDRDAAKYTDAQLDQLCAVVALTPWHLYQFWTEDPGRLLEYFDGTTTRSGGLRLAQAIAHAGVEFDAQNERYYQVIDSLRSKGGDCLPLPNLWLGAIVHNQPEAKIGRAHV